MTLAALTFTITMGWWIFPAIITLISIIIVIHAIVTEPSGIGSGICSLFMFLIGFSVSSFSWLIWSLLCR